MSVDLMDTDGTLIQASFFNEAAKKYDNILEQNRIYTWSNGSIKLANKRFTSIKNDFCLTFNNNAEI